MDGLADQILDSYLTMFYRTAARAAAIDVGQQRPSLAPLRTLYWERCDGTSSPTKPHCGGFAGCSRRPARHWRGRRLKGSVTCGFLTCSPLPHRQGQHGQPVHGLDSDSAGTVRSR